MSLGKGIIYGTSTRQKLTTKSSTEAELVGVSDVMPQVVWTRYFLEAQGYDVSDSIVYQDNKSAILLEKHGKASSSKRTRHINIRYYFVTDRIADKEVSVEYCPTLQMLADYFTKPLQGTQFQILRNRIMNFNPSQDQVSDYRSVLNNLVSEGVIEGQTADEWKTVQCKFNKKKVGLDSKSTCNHCNGLNTTTRECEAFTMVNANAKQRMQSGITIKDSIHDRECNEDNNAIRERNSRLDG